MKIFDCIKCGTTHANEGGWRNKGNGWYCVNKVRLPEFTTQSIKEGYKNPATIQPWRGGDASLEFINEYPKQKDKFFSKEEQKRARNVWR